MGLIDLPGHATTSLRAIARPRLPSWTLGLWLQGLGERSRLAEAGPSRLGELPLQMIDLPSKPLSFPLPLIPFPSEGVTLAIRALGPLTPFTLARRLGRPR